MIDENKTAMNDTPPAPNGHANGTATTATTEDAPKDASASSKKKKKKKKVHQHNQPPKTTPVDTAAAPTAEAPSTEPAAPADTTVASDSTAPMAEEPTATPIADTTTAAPAVDATAAPSVDTAPIAAPAESLRLRMKVWTDPATAKRYLIPSAFMRDLVNGQPVSDVMYAYVMSDEDTKLILLKAGEWNALPFFYFQEDGPAPRASKRPVDVI